MSFPESMREMPAVQYVVEGGRSLHGTIRPSGNKNAALPIVAAALISQNPVRLENVPHIRDIETLMELIRSVGAKVEWTGDNSLLIEARDLTARDLDAELCSKIRASILLAAPLLARCGEIILPPPGGDVIGRRRLDTHFLALEQLGAKVSLEGGLLRLSVKGFRGEELIESIPVDDIAEGVREYVDGAREAINDVVRAEMNDLRKAVRRQRKRIGI